MNRRRLLVIGLLALCTLVTVAVYRILHLGTRDSETSRVDVAVATRDLRPEERIGEGDIKIAQLPGNEIPPACFRDKSQVGGHQVILPISKGNIIRHSDLATTEESHFRWPDMRAVSVGVGEIVSTTGFLEPGTRVDVLLSRAPKGGRKRTTTVLKNVCEIVAAQGPSPGALRQSVSIFLLLSPDDAQKLAQVRQSGQIRLSVLQGLPSCM